MGFYESSESSVVEVLGFFGVCLTMMMLMMCLIIYNGPIIGRWVGGWLQVMKRATYDTFWRTLFKAQQRLWSWINDERFTQKASTSLWIKNRFFNLLPLKMIVNAAVFSSQGIDSKASKKWVPNARDIKLDVSLVICTNASKHRIFARFSNEHDHVIKYERHHQLKPNETISGLNLCV